jgi:hypothetical protein
MLNLICYILDSFTWPTPIRLPGGKKGKPQQICGCAQRNCVTGIYLLLCLSL